MVLYALAVTFLFSAAVMSMAAQARRSAPLGCRAHNALGMRGVVGMSLRQDSGSVPPPPPPPKKNTKHPVIFCFQTNYSDYAVHRFTTFTRLAEGIFVKYRPFFRLLSINTKANNTLYFRKMPLRTFVHAGGLGLFIGYKDLIER